MNERKFSKKLDDMTCEEKARKDKVWESISIQTGVETKRKNYAPMRFAMTVAMCCLVLCIAIPLCVIYMGKPDKHVGVGSASDIISGVGSFNSADNPNRFGDNDYIYVASPISIAEIAKQDSNILYGKNWEREPKSTSLMKLAQTSVERVIGIRDKSYDAEKNLQITVNILYKDVSIERFDKEIEKMKLNENTLDNVKILWRTADGGNSYASFKYNEYTYFIHASNASGGSSALDAAKTLLGK